eukprot:1160187-Pelagomonas_calceolata.AAC.2
MAFAPRRAVDEGHQTLMCDMKQESGNLLMCCTAGASRRSCCSSSMKTRQGASALPRPTAAGLHGACQASVAFWAMLEAIHAAPPLLHPQMQTSASCTSCSAWTQAAQVLFPSHTEACSCHDDESLMMKTCFVMHMHIVYTRAVSSTSCCTECGSGPSCFPEGSTH